MPNVEKIIVLDYGSQFNQLITRRIREFGVFSELLSHRITADEVKAINPKGIILSGGPNSVYADNAFDIDEEILNLGIPVLGICYGMQLITHKLGGKVEGADKSALAIHRKGFGVQARAGTAQRIEAPMHARRR